MTGRSEILPRTSPWIKCLDLRRARTRGTWRNHSLTDSITTCASRRRVVYLKLHALITPVLVDASAHSFEIHESCCGVWFSPSADRPSVTVSACSSKLRGLPKLAAHLNGRNLFEKRAFETFDRSEGPDELAFAPASCMLSPYHPAPLDRLSTVPASKQCHLRNGLHRDSILAAHDASFNYRFLIFRVLEEMNERGYITNWAARGSNKAPNRSTPVLLFCKLLAAHHSMLHIDI